LSAPWRPTKAQILAAADRTVPDVIGPDLRVLFCGINPGLYTAAVGHHFARPGNRFWKVLHEAGFTEQVLSAFQDRSLLSSGIGITNLVARATATADELGASELRDGARLLEAKVAAVQPRIVAVLGMQAFRTAFGSPRAAPGPQSAQIAKSSVWLLPNTSGLQAHYQLGDLVVLFNELRAAADL
jgi:TDG/mug DNA glycosylase family protein